MRKENNTNNDCKNDNATPEGVYDCRDCPFCGDNGDGSVSCDKGYWSNRRD
jgi:hypothetical protein